MPNQLEIADFNLEVLKAHAKIRVDLLKAYSDYNFRMAEVAEKLTQVARNREELRQLKEAHKEYKSALAEVKKERRQAERDEEQITRAARNAERLSWGEWLDADLVTPAWTGFRALCNRAPGQTRAQIFSKKVASEHRLGDHFSRNRSPNTQCESAPGTVKNAISLFEWARRKSYIPRVGSPPQDVLFEILSSLHESAEAELTALAAKLTSAREELMQLRMVNWRQVGIAAHPPKEPST